MTPTTPENLDALPGTAGAPTAQGRVFSVVRNAYREDPGYPAS